MKRTQSALCALIFALPAAAQEPTAAQLEFFEKKVRPVLIEHCYECHAATSKKLKAGLRVDSRAALLEGGDNGPALVPGDPDKSRLIEAIRYTNVDLKMPRKSKLPDAVIADLTAWVKMGAPWPAEKLTKKSTTDAFDVHRRKKEHWSWQPIQASDPPVVKDQSWPRSDIDRFLLAKLEAKGLTPARDADPHTLLRRLHFDLVGLPPARAEVEAFAKEYAVPGTQYSILEKTVDRLLASPQFGERWARHWLDLVRYAESRGHEFDYTIPNAYQYRDYVIRALNEDVPYNQFVHEHVAGDLLPRPRLGANGANESILGTAFWFLGEECHSPVDIRQDQADRFDNRIDVMTKAFLGLTVACARCHDHKFDAISTKDYYALFGVLESSSYRLARFDTITHNRKISENLWRLRTEARPKLQQALGEATRGTIAWLPNYLWTAVGIAGYDTDLDPDRVKRWKAAIAAAEKNEASPLHLLARATAERQRPVQDVLQAIYQRWDAVKTPDLKNMDVVVRYDQAAAPGLPEDGTFGLAPLRPGDFILGGSPDRPVARVVEQGAVERDRAWDGLRLTAGTHNESGALGGTTRAGRTLRTPEFTLKHGRVHALVKGSGMIYAAVAQHVMLAGPLHGSLVQKFNTGGSFQWVTVNLSPYNGQRTHLEFTPGDQADFALVAVVQSAQPPAPHASQPHSLLRRQLAAAKSLQDVGRAYAAACAIAMSVHKDGSGQDVQDSVPFANWIVQHLDLFIMPGSPEARQLAESATPILAEQKQLLAQLKLESRLAPAMQDGSGTDERVFVRGNPKTLGDVVPRRLLEALAGPQPLPVKQGSGRLELARQMTDPATTPFITRVYVNRVWHHLLGRGIVASVDNFGVLGETPTHPELLDYLADRFAKEGWSLKKLIRAIVLSRAYQMSSAPDARADDADPENLLLHRARVRRLEGEAIRDAILRVSGRLNPTMFGPSIPVHLTPFQEGRGRPASGPLDGEGRRSIYLAVRRNFLSSFLLAFDTPSPFSTVGRRTVSNVPAQALILMNDPFVHQQADVWARRVVAEKADDTARVRGMYVDAFARLPSDAETRACLAFLGATPDQRRWADLAHVLINAKEFYFVN